MQPSLVIKQGANNAQVMQQGMVAVPMTVNSSMSGSIPNVMTLNNPGGQNVVVTSQNMGGGQPGSMLPNVQILNMRPGAPPMAPQKSVAAVSPRVVIGSPQVVGARQAAPGITLQTLQSLQPGQQGHLLLKTENGQYQLLRVGPAPAPAPPPSSLAAPLTQTIRLSTVPAHPGVATVSTSMAMQVAGPGSVPSGSGAPLGVVPQQQQMQQQQMQHQQMQQHQMQQQQMQQQQMQQQQMQQQQMQQQPVTASGSTYVKPSDNTKEKCRNFLANLMDLSSKEPPSVEANVRKLIQELIYAQVEPEEFCDRLEKLLNASPQPCLIGFLKKSLPLLRQSLVNKELVIEGINPPGPHIVFGGIPPPMPQPVMATTSQIKPVSKPGGTISVLQNIPVHTKVNVNKASSSKNMAVNKSNIQRGAQSTVLSTVLTPGKSLLKEKERKSTSQFTQQFSDDKMAGDDDINDVAAMGGVNLAEETQRILGSTDMIGSQIRSCKEEYLVPLPAMQARVKAISARHGLDEPGPEVASLLTHALHERLKNLIEKLAVIAQHRIDQTKTDSRYETTQDVKGQLKFLEELDRVDKKRREDSEREILMRAAKSRSKNEDPEQAKLKAKAKEMQRAELEELRQREANLTALQAIGSRKKPRLDGAGDAVTAQASTSGSGASLTGRSQLALRTRLKRINQRDMMFLLETDRSTARSLFLYKSYLK